MSNSKWTRWATGGSSAATEKPAAEPPADNADGYTREGPGPLDAIRFKWTVKRGEDSQYYVQETIGECTRSFLDGPMTAQAAIKFVDDRASDALVRFEMLRNDMLGRAADFAKQQRSETAKSFGLL
ncbi:MAG: hypothetical protein FWD68_10830 [Alphaproteobacteria bacterium]|nr:hypothetical protein [Alphaproteobacteria bacterium]